MIAEREEAAVLFMSPHTHQQPNKKKKRKRKKKTKDSGLKSLERSLPNLVQRRNFMAQNIKFDFHQRLRKRKKERERKVNEKERER